MKVSAVLLIVAHVTLIYCATDPTTVCLPKQLSVNAFDVVNEYPVNSSVDFNLNKTASSFLDGSRIVVDLVAGKAYTINSAGCTSAVAAPAQLLSQCLPASAVSLGTLTFGVEAPAALEGFMYTAGSTNISLLISSEACVGSYPVLRKDYTPEGNAITLISNPVASVANASIFDIPAVCPEAIVVG